MQRLGVERIHAAAVGVLLFVVGGCVATKTDLSALAGRVSYVESRLERAEDLATEAGGVAAQQVIESRRELGQKLDDVRVQVADLTARVQALEIQLREQGGLQTEMERELAGISGALSDLGNRLAALEGATTAGGSGGGTVPDPALFQWSSEKEGYQAALASFNEGRLDRARQQLNELQRRWPQGVYAANVQFWLGEIHYRERDFINAIDHYLKVIESYAKSPKAPAAYYKMALALVELGERDNARRALEDMLRLYPEAEEAPKAREALESLGL